MEAENEAAAWCEDEWGVAARDTFVTDRKIFLLLLSHDAVLRSTSIFVRLCQIWKVNVTLLGSLLNYQKLGINGLLFQLYIPCVTAKNDERTIVSWVMYSLNLSQKGISMAVKYIPKKGSLVFLCCNMHLPVFVFFF